MALSIAIVGLPNVGKSTLFNTLTQKKVDASNYPFCTIDPNVGVVKVPDERLNKLAEISKPKKIIPTTIEFVDVAGLVKGAHKGEGLGNQFLSHIRECDAICEVVRNFHNDNIIHVEGKVNPNEDRETINMELIYADLSTVEKRLEKLVKEVRTGDKDTIKKKAILENIKKELDQGKAVRSIEISEDDYKLIKDLNLLTKKPIIYILNENDDSQSIDYKIWDGEVVSLNIKLEEEISLLNPEEQKEYIKELGLNESGLDKLIKASYKLLNLDTFFTTGSDETKAWTITHGSRAPQAAGRIHTDFEKGFIRAEVILWDKFIEAGSEQVAREKGLLRIEGKDYVMKDGDVCHFLFN